MKIVVKHISQKELEDFHSVLKEAALWLRSEGNEMWSEGQLSIETLLKNNSIEQMFVGYINDEAAAAMILQEDDTWWPVAKNNDSLFLHKLAVRRKYAKMGISKEMVNWAKSYAKKLNKTYLRLDCASDRPKLCDFYESQGFAKTSERVLFFKPRIIANMIKQRFEL